MTAATRPPSARERLLAAADELFYAEGVNSVGIDRVIDRAGVAKASLYSTFGSKDELVRAYLQARHRARVERITRGLAGTDDPRERILEVFAVLGRVFESPSFRGCAFLNAAAEARTGSVVESITGEYRRWLGELFRGLLVEAGAPDPDALVPSLVLLYDGATVSATMDRDRAPADTARAVAAMLLDAALGTEG